MKTTNSLYDRGVRAPWAWSLRSQLALALISLIAFICFKTLLALIFCFCYLAVFFALRRIWKGIKKRGSQAGTLSEAAPEMYLMKLDDGTELRVPKNSSRIFTERKDGNVSRVLFSAVLECNTADGTAIPAPEIKTQTLPKSTSAKRFLLVLTSLSAIILFVCAYTGELFDHSILTLRDAMMQERSPYSGGYGTSLEDAVVLSPEASVSSEYDYLSNCYPSGNYEIKNQKLLSENGRIYTCLEIRIFRFGEWDEREFWFDVTAIFPNLTPEDLADE